jgi:hypothetical protein
MLTFRDTLVDTFDSSDDVPAVSGHRLRVPPPLPYDTVIVTGVTGVTRTSATATSSLAKEPALPAPPRLWPRPRVIPPRSPVGMLAHEMTRRIADHMTAARSVVTLLETEVVCLDDETPTQPPLAFLPERPPARPRATRPPIRRSVILPWPAALMLLAIAGGVVFEHVQRGDLGEVVQTGIDSTRVQLADAARRVHF